MDDQDQDGAGQPEPELQFDKAEYQEAAPATSCVACHRPIAEQYFEVNGKIVCQRCKGAIETALTGKAGAGMRLLRATVFGIGAAALGSGIYFAVSALTGYEIGLIGILVGFLVGRAVHKGARGRGGWGYQLLAMFLTYSAIVSTYVPPLIKAFAERAQKEPAAAKSGATGATGSERNTTAGAEPASPPVAPATPATTERPKIGAGGVALALLFVFAIAFVAPFLAGVQNILGILIIGFSVYQAWKMNRRPQLRMTGPHRIGVAPVVASHG